jgi:hypothetical protein
MIADAAKNIEEDAVDAARQWERVFSEGVVITSAGVPQHYSNMQ